MADNKIKIGFDSIYFFSLLFDVLTLLHSERRKLYTILALLSAIGLNMFSMLTSY